MNIPQENSPPGTPDALPVESQLRSALSAVLTPLAVQQVTAREAYAAMTRVVARIEGDVPTGARLVGLLQLFNAQRPDGVPPIPAGTAGVAQDCVAAYRRTLVKAASQGVAHKTLPPDLIEGLNQWLERLLELMTAEISRPYETEAQKLRTRTDEELAAARAQSEAERQAVRDTVTELEARLRACQQEAELQQQGMAMQASRLAELQSALDLASAEGRELATRVAVLQTQLLDQERQAAQAREDARLAREAQDEERRQRLLALDSARVAEQELAREKERRRSAEGMGRALEKYLEEEKAKLAGLQAALASIQIASEPSPQAARPGSRIKPARPQGLLTGAALARKKTLR
jgi:hypothetical protein